MQSWQKNIVAILFGVGVVLLAELVLQIAHFHSPACDLDPFVSFEESAPVLIDKTSQGKTTVQINPRLASYFNSVEFPKEKSKTTRRIFVLGGSDVMGFPFLAPGSFAQFLSLGLKSLDPQHDYQVVNLSGFGYASYRVLRVFKDALNFEPDLMIVMTGHNEFLEKREYSAPEKITQFQKKLSRYKIYCLLKAFVFKIHKAPGKPLISTEVKWEHFTLDPEMREKIIEHYKFNIGQMAALARDKNVPLLMLTLPSNLRDFPPFHSEHKKDLSAGELAEWQNYSKESDRLISEKQFAEAATLLKKEIVIDPDYALSYYQLGQCLLKIGPEQDAIYAFEIALEKDAWQVRALPEFNNAIRDLSSQAHVLDLEPIFYAASPDGIPGDNLFYDHCHPHLETQSLIAKEILRTLGEKGLIQLPDSWENIYDSDSKAYIDSLPKPFIAKGYYRLAVEIGVNMGLKELGKKYLELGLSTDPENPQLKILSEKFK
jgi:tetratricopeptide (TPR) repeat protein